MGGLAPWRVELVLGLDEINRSDLYATPTDAVRQLTGHPPRTVEHYIERNRTAFLVIPARFAALDGQDGDRVAQRTLAGWIVV